MRTGMIDLAARAIYAIVQRVWSRDDPEAAPHALLQHVTV